MKVVLLRYQEDGTQKYWPEALSAIEAVGLAAKLDKPELVTITIPACVDPVLALSSLAVSVVEL
jgi:hypothetical protein